MLSSVGQNSIFSLGLLAVLCSFSCAFQPGMKSLLLPLGIVSLAALRMASVNSLAFSFRWCCFWFLLFSLGFFLFVCLFVFLFLFVCFCLFVFGVFFNEVLVSFLFCSSSLGTVFFVPVADPAWWQEVLVCLHFLRAVVPCDVRLF